ncbi:MAG: carboxylesterase family protein [Planctomycetota bacterium]
MFKRLLSLPFAFLSTLALAQDEPGPKIAEPIIVDGGKIGGGEESPMGGVTAWKGIPYAAPPVGPLRWKPPQLVAPWQGLMNCTDFGPACHQPPSALALPPDVQNKAEDCLRINVWSPAKRVTDKLPVFVWIHGSCGGFARGASSEPIYEGEFLAKRKVVVVSFNYRLGVLGWLAHPELSKESADGVSGNYGLMDQIAALEWVKRNIAKFGGDPGKVTVAGQSGGAACIAALMVCPKAKGLFQRAILQGAGPRWIRRKLREPRGSLDSGEDQGEFLLSRLKCGADKPLEALRSRSIEELFEGAQTAEGPFGVGEQWGPVIDGVLIPDDPWTMWRNGQQADMPIICGANANDGSIFGVPKGVVDVWQYNDWVKREFPGDPEPIWKAFAPNLRDDVPAMVVELYSDALAVEPVRFVARAHAERGRKVYLYFFSRVSPGAEKRKIGAYHGAETAYTFGNMVGPVGHDQTDHMLARKLCDAWAQFVKTGDPNIQDFVEWPACVANMDGWLEIGDDLRVARDVRTERLDVLASAREKEEAPKK